MGQEKRILTPYLQCGANLFCSFARSDILTGERIACIYQTKNGFTTIYWFTNLDLLKRIYYNTAEETKKIADEMLISMGYEFLTQEQYEKLKVLL